MESNDGLGSPLRRSMSKSGSNSSKSPSSGRRKQPSSDMLENMNNHSMNSNDSIDDDRMLSQMKSIQDMEREAKDVLTKYMAAISERSKEDYTAKLKTTLQELKKVEAAYKECTIENHKLTTKCQQLEDKLNSIQTKHVEDQLKSQEMMSEMDRKSRKLISDQQSQIQMFQIELQQKNAALRKLEDENSQARIDSGQFEAKYTALDVEVNEMQAAMASLHAEISALQKELEESKYKEKEATQNYVAMKTSYDRMVHEITQLREEKSTLKEEVISMEQQLNDALSTLNINSNENKSRIDSLVMERESLQASLAKKEAKLRHQSTTNQDLNAALGKLHNELISVKQELEKSLEQCNHLEESSARELNEMRERLQTSEDHTNKLVKTMSQMKDEFAQLNIECSKLKSSLDSSQGDNKKLSKRVSLLEQEKQDLLMEISQQAKVVKELEKSREQLNQGSIEDRQALENEKRSRLSAENALATKEIELNSVTSMLSQKCEQVVYLERQINEASTLKEQALETSRNQQKDSANRIVELTQKVSRLTSDLSSSQEELAQIKKSNENLSVQLKESQNESDDRLAKFNAINKKLQESEDANEEFRARLEAMEADGDDMKKEHQVQLQKMNDVMSELNTKHQRELSELKLLTQKEMDELRQNSITTKQTLEYNHEKNMTKLKETFQRQIEELKTAKQREVNDARIKTSTIASAMETLQRELREESNKNIALQEELVVLRDMVENGSDEAKIMLQNSQKEFTREKNRLENMISDLQEQVRSVNEKLTYEEQKNHTNVEALKREKDNTTRVVSKIRGIEQENTELKEELNNLSTELANVKKQLKESERKFTNMLASKEDEISRISRRNEVLSDAVTRLTQMNSGGGPGSANREEVYAFGRGGNLEDRDSQSYQGQLNSYRSGSWNGGDNGGHGNGGVDYKRASPITAYRKDLKSPGRRAPPSPNRGNKTDRSDPEIGVDHDQSVHDIDGMANSEVGSVTKAMSRGQSAPTFRSLPSPQSRTSMDRNSFSNQVNETIPITAGNNSSNRVNESMMMVQKALESRRNSRGGGKNTTANMNTPTSNEPHGSYFVGSIADRFEGFKNDEVKESVKSSLVFDDRKPTSQSQIQSTPRANSLPLSLPDEKSVSSPAENSGNFDSVMSGGKEKTAFPDRIRVEVEHGKETLLPYSPNPKQYQHQGGGITYLADSGNEDGNRKLLPHSQKVDKEKESKRPSSQSQQSKKDELARKAYGAPVGIKSNSKK